MTTVVSFVCIVPSFYYTPYDISKHFLERIMFVCYVHTHMDFSVGDSRTEIRLFIYLVKPLQMEQTVDFIIQTYDYVVTR